LQDVNSLQYEAEQLATKAATEKAEVLGELDRLHKLVASFQAQIREVSCLLKGRGVVAGVKAEGLLFWQEYDGCVGWQQCSAHAGACPASTSLVAASLQAQIREVSCTFVGVLWCARSSLLSKCFVSEMTAMAAVQLLAAAWSLPWTSGWCLSCMRQVAASSQAQIREVRLCFQGCPM
jgi:hypothetical protein